MPQTAPRRGPKIRAPISFFPPKIRPKSGVAFGAAWPLGLYLKVTRNAKEPRVQAERQQKAYSNFLLYISNRYSGKQYIIHHCIYTNRGEKITSVIKWH